MDYNRFFYEHVIGYYPDNPEDIKQTTCTIEYLTNCGFSGHEISKILLAYDGEEPRFSPSDLPDTLWENSLIRRDTYYFHKELKIVSPPPVIGSDGSEKRAPFFVEMKIRYTIDDLLNYFYTTLKVDSEFRVYKRDVSQIRSMLDSYKSYREVAPVDMILFLIDERSHERTLTLQPFDINIPEMAYRVYDKLKRNRQEATLEGANRIVWRKEPVATYMNSVAPKTDILGEIYM